MKSSSGVATALFLATSMQVAFAEPQQVPMVRLEAQVDIAAAAGDVWTELTSGPGLVRWSPVWKSPANAKLELAHVGDHLELVDEWGNHGTSVVTHFDVRKELRTANDPDDGSYVCRSSFVLAPAAALTHVRWIEQYSDPSSAADLQATAQKVNAGMQKSLLVLKNLAEKK
jgi:hypothetical protein